MTRAREAEIGRLAMERYWSGAQASRVVEAWRESGDSAARFCRRYGLKPERLRYWRDRLAQASEGGSVEALAFLPVRVTAEQGEGARRSPAGIVVRGGCGLEVEVERGFDEETFGRVLRCLGEAGAW